MKRRPTFCVIKEIQIKMRYHYTRVRMPQIQKTIINLEIASCVFSVLQPVDRSPLAPPNYLSSSLVLIQLTSNISMHATDVI